MKLFKQFIGMPEADVVSGKAKLRALWIFVGIILVSLFITSGARIYNYQHFSEGLSGFLPDSFADQVIMFSVYALLNIGALIYAYCNARKNNNKNSRLLLGATLAGVGVAGLGVLAAFLFTDLLTLNLLASRFAMGTAQVEALLQNYANQYGKLYLVPLLPTLLSFAIFGFHRNRNRKKTSGAFGTAEFAEKADLKEMGAYSKGALFGKDKQDKYLRYPLCNRTIIAQPGGGKSAGIVIPALLTEERPVFVHDVKGELWAVTARHRHEEFGHEVVTIDPFNVTKSKDFIVGKPNYLASKRYSFNPLDFIPQDAAHRDRAITALVNSLMSKSNYGNAKDNHFEAYAEILLMGLIEWVVMEADIKNLITVHDYLCLDKKSFEELLKEMQDSNHIRAKAAASQILKTGPEERGSIYSSTYKQISWLADQNMREFAESSSFNLKHFLHGTMDVYVVMPEDQVKPQSRIIRMMITSLRNLLVQVAPSDLPDLSSLFIFDEQGQLDYCPDIEEMLEVLRARGVVIWSVFQTLGQIKQYKKPDLFMGSVMKQFFSVDDLDTMEWIQKLGGKKTIMTESASKSDSQSSSKNGGKSTNKSTSSHETATDLIHYNEIRELKKDSQFVFIHGQRPILCKKIRYFEETFFAGSFDPNPLEKQRH